MKPKKISFGFAKITKKTALTVVKKEVNKEIQFIDCLEGKSIKLVNGEDENKDSTLVIPLKNANLLRDNMIEALKARAVERNKKPPKENSKGETNGDVTKENETESKSLTLDELAAKEIMEDLKKGEDKDKAEDDREIPQSNLSQGEKESTLEDYENVPVTAFGLAVLRGMGWKPDVGIGKNGQIVTPINPVVRPKGMGLGADKVLKPTTVMKSGEELVMKNAAPLKIVSGQHKNLYGVVAGFEELPGRILVRLTLQNSVISISENLVQLVTKEEYSKNSKILNLNDYDSFHEKKMSINPVKVLDKKIVKEPPRQVEKMSKPEERRKSRSAERNKPKNEDRKSKYSDSSDSDYYRSKKNEKLKKYQSRMKYEDHSTSKKSYKCKVETSESDSDLKPQKYDDKKKSLTTKSSKYSKKNPESSASESPPQRKKTKSKKHSKSHSRHRSRSRSPEKKKKKKHHRSRS